MDGKGRAIDNVLIERLWRSVKTEYVHINPAMEALNFTKHEEVHGVL